MSGEVRVDVSPFSEIATVSNFVQALASLEGVTDVYVRGFDADCAQIELRLEGDVPLAALLETLMPYHLTVDDDGGDILRAQLGSRREAP